MAEIKFGVSQRKHPVPASISRGIDIFSGAAGIISTYLATAPFVPSDVSNIVVSILGLLTALAQFLKPYFGVQVNTLTVPTKDVNEIEDKPLN